MGLELGFVFIQIQKVRKIKKTVAKIFLLNGYKMELCECEF